jgi:hypothetical protein
VLSVAGTSRAGGRNEAVRYSNPLTAQGHHGSRTINPRGAYSGRPSHQASNRVELAHGDWNAPRTSGSRGSSD